MPATIVSVVVAIILSKWLAPPLDGASFHRDVLNFAISWTLYKPDEQLRYLFILILLPVFIVGFYASLINTRLFVTEKNVIAVQLLFFIFIVWNFFYQVQYTHDYFEHSFPLIGFCAFFTWRTRNFSKMSGNVLTAFIGFIVACVALLDCVATDHNISLAHSGFAGHLHYTLGEFAAVLNGRTTAVDFFPQYSQLLPYLALPLFKAIPLSVTSFTGFMTACSLCIFGCGYYILRKTVDSSWVALLFFLSWIGFCFYPLGIDGSGSRYVTFNYFAVGPIRFLGFWILAAVAVSLAREKLKSYHEIVAVFLSTLAVLNNLDFGIPAALACVFILYIVSPRRWFTLLYSVIGLTAALALWVTITFIRSGQVPDVMSGLIFQRACARYGFTSIHTPPWGLHWVLVLTLLSSLAAGLFGFWNSRYKDSPSPEDKYRWAAFVFFGLAGSGTFSYYMNRSHWHVLVLCTVIAIFPVFIFTGKIFKDWKEAMNRKLLFIPLLVCLTATGAGLSLLFRLNPLASLQQFSRKDDSFSSRQAALVKTIQSYSQPEKPVVIIYPYGFLLANLASVKNVFPYTQDGSLILRSQLNRVTETITTLGVETLFGIVSVELSEWLTINKYREILHDGDFAVWKKTKNQSVPSQ